MTQHAANAGMPGAHIEERRSRLLRSLERAARPIGAGGMPLSSKRVEFLAKGAEDLYWNELAWEELTDEERVVGGHLTELVFPGFLAFVNALLVERPVEDRSGEVTTPHPEVVERILLFLATRYTTLTAELVQGADSERLVWARAMTSHLIDLVLYRLYGLSQDELDALEAGG